MAEPIPQNRRRHPRRHAMDGGAARLGRIALLTHEHQKEALARTYVAAVAGHAGMTCSFANFDYGIDVTLNDVRERARGTASGKRYNESGHKLDIQIKSATIGRTATVRHEVIVYDLDAETYNDLRQPKVGTPRILVLLVLPESKEEQLHQTEQALCLRQCCYWLSLKDKGEVRNRSTVRIELPRKNVFSEEQQIDVELRWVPSQVDEFFDLARSEDPDSPDRLWEWLFDNATRVPRDRKTKARKK